MAQHTCARCDEEVVRVGRCGPWPTYCSRSCKAATARELAALRPSKYVPASKPLREVACSVCGGAFVAKRSDAHLCSSACGNRYRDALGGCSVDSCDRGVRAGGKCNMHYKAELRAAGRIVEQAWNDRRRNNAQARRARMKGARTGGSVFLSEILERDGTDCHLCGKPVDMTLAWPHRDSKSVDHIIPLSKGGAHDPSNCALAHMGCNSSKGARLAA